VIQLPTPESAEIAVVNAVEDHAADPAELAEVDAPLFAEVVHSAERDVVVHHVNHANHESHAGPANSN
jgi:hypothetical protein